jgi:hypothetical protein
MMIPILELFVFFCISFFTRYDWMDGKKEGKKEGVYRSWDREEITPTLYPQLERLPTLPSSIASIAINQKFYHMHFSTDIRLCFPRTEPSATFGGGSFGEAAFPTAFLPKCQHLYICPTSIFTGLRVTKLLCVLLTLPLFGSIFNHGPNQDH